jgi:dolichyl-phosphate-mannose--protein O-mannosyl transferase
VNTTKSTTTTDNAHVAQSRLILLDATLIFFIALTMYSYIRFRKLRYWEFSLQWWGWLIATGFFMACAWGSKVNGPLTVVAIGIAVLIDLWGLLDVNKEGHTMVNFFYRCLAIVYVLTHIFRNTSGNTLVLVPLVLLLCRSLSICHSFGSTLLS